MVHRISRGKLIGRGKKSSLGAYKTKVPPTGTSGMIDASLITGTMSSVHNIYPLTADTYTLGSTTKEWLALYIGDAGGIYFGLSQDIFLSRTAADKLGLAAGDTFQADTLETDTIYLDRTNLDVRLYRFAANKLGLDSGDTFCLATIEEIVGGGGIRCNSMFNIGPAYNTRIYAGSQKIEMGDRSAAWDVELYRDGANVLRTNDLFKIIRPLAADYGLGIAVSGDSEYRILVLANGTVRFGSGGAVQDVNLYRSAANVLKTDDKLELNNQPIYMSAMAGGGSTILSSIIAATATDIFEIEADGTIRWGDGTNPFDVNILRSAANTITLTASAGVILTAGLTVGSDIVSDTADTDSLGSATKEWLNLYIGNSGKIYLGTSQTVSIQRTAINTMTILASSGVIFNAGLTVGSDIVSDTADTDSLGSTSKEWLNIYIGDAGKLYFGLSQDVNLYRESANELRTDDALNVGDTVYNIRIRDDAAVIYFGDRSGSWDTNLFRAAAHTLKTADDFQIGTGKGLYTDLIGEFTGGAGVTIDSVLLKDSDVICDEIYLDIANQDCVLKRGGANLIQTPDDIEASMFQSVKGAAAGTSYKALVQGEANARFVILVTGEMRWSSGALAQDTNLYRGAANVLKTDDQFEAVGGIIVGADIVSDTADTDSLGSTSKEWLNLYIGDAGKIYLGLGQDVSINRSAANTLLLTATTAVKVSDTLLTKDITPHTWGDTYSLGSPSFEWANIYMGDVGKFYLGISQDVNLYRGGANILKTDDTFIVVGQLQIPTSGSGAGILIGGDILLYRDAANVLRTPDTIRSDVRFLGIGAAGAQALFSAAITGDAQDRCVIRADGSINFGTGAIAQDTKLYRSAANVLKTDDTFEVALGVYHSNVVTKTNADTPYTVAASDRVILCDTSGGVIELDLPAVAGVTGMILTIKKTTADVAVVTLDGSGAEEIDGAVNNVEIDAQWDTLTIYCDGTQWLIISHKIA